MKLIVGLGNPGIEYAFTPHNLGFLTVDRLAEQYNAHVANRRCRALTGKAVVGSEEVLLAKPETYMNLSGLSVRELLVQYDLKAESDLLVIYDELDLPFGSIRVRQRGGTAGHNGMESVIGALGTQEFSRIRLGVAPDHPVKDGASYLLAPFKRSQEKAVVDMIDTAAEAAKTVIAEGVNVAMNRFNRKIQGAAPEGEQAPGN